MVYQLYYRKATMSFYKIMCAIKTKTGQINNVKMRAPTMELYIERS